MSDDRKYCMCCGEDVHVNPVVRAGRVELTCISCGFTLDILPRDEPPRPARCIMMVDSSEVARALLNDLFSRSRLADEIVSLASGAEFVTAVSQRLAEGLPIDLVVLEIAMPGMDGIAAARFLRSAEIRLKRPPCPVIFFSARTADEDLRRQMAIFKPAWYFKKGPSDDREGLAQRVTALFGHISKIVTESAPHAAS